MAIYSYPESNVIDKVTFRKTENGSLRAYLHAKDGADAGQLQQLRANLKSKEIDSIKIEFNDQPAVELRGLKKETDLLDLLKQQKVIGGQSTLQKEAADTITFKQKFSKNTLQAGGVFMGMADLCYLGFGALTKSLDNAVAGGTYFLGSVTMGAYGRNDQSQKQVRSGAQHLLNYAKEHDLTLSDANDAALVVKQKLPSGFFAKTHNYIKEHPSEVGNMLIAVAGALIAKSAIQDRILPRILLKKPAGGAARSMMLKTDEGTKAAFELKLDPNIKLKEAYEKCGNGLADVALGTSTITSGTIATFGKEKAHDPDKPRRKGLAGIKDWVVEHTWDKPLAMASLGYLGSTAWHAKTTYSEGKEAKAIIAAPLGKYTKEKRDHAKKLKNALPYRGFFVGLSIIGEVLMMVSSKGHGDGVVNDKSVDSSVIAMGAELIAQQPEARQETQINNMAKYLGRPDVLAMKDNTLAAQLRRQVAANKKSPWSGMKAAVSNSLEKSAEPVADKTQVLTRSKTAGWQIKMDAEKEFAPAAGVTSLA